MAGVSSDIVWLWQVQGETADPDSCTGFAGQPLPA